MAASAALVRRLSARPCASLAIVFADAGRDDEDVGVADELEVRERVVVGRGLAGEGAARGVALELVDEDRRAGQRRERGGADEARARRRLDDPHGVARRRREADELKRLVGGDPAADTEQDPWP